MVEIMPLTLEDIARLSGYSRSTVSRVINGDPNVNEATRKKVMEVVQRMNFQPNLAARGLVAGNTRVIGLVIPRAVSIIFADPYFPQLIQGVTQACNLHDYSVMLWLAEPEYERRTVSKILYSGLVQGVVVASMLMYDTLITAMDEKNLPFILIGRHPANDRVNYADVDNRTAARDAVMHLIRVGRRRVGEIAGPQNVINGFDRHAGYMDALREKGLAFNSDLMAEGDFTEESGYFCMQRLLACHPDAVFIHSDAMAVGAMRAINEAGLSVPDDIAILGFDDNPFAAHTTPPLSTVRQPISRLGYVATEVLIDIIAHPDIQPRRIILPTELVIRSSCGAISS